MRPVFTVRLVGVRRGAFVTLIMGQREYYIRFRQKNELQVRFLIRLKLATLTTEKSGAVFEHGCADYDVQGGMYMSTSPSPF